MEFFEIADIVDAAFVYDVNKRYMWVCLLIAACCYAALYVFKSIALYTIARREGFGRKWMAFVPIFSTYYIGVVSEKNTIVRTKAKNISFAAALVELVFVALSIAATVSKFIIFNGGYAEPVYDTVVLFGVTVEQLVGYNPVNLPVELNWVWWFAMNSQNYLLYLIEVAFIILNVFILIAFFRTYSPSRYLLFSILGMLFPISAVFMFAVRNNRATNYLDYVREQQQRQYRMYQEYMRGNMRGNGQNYYGGYQNDPYAGQQNATPPEDPFGGLGADGRGSDGNAGGDPFDEFKN